MWKRLWPYVLASALVAGGVVAYVVAITVSDHDSTHRWTAIAAVFAGTAVLIALLGLPFALYQLRELTRGARAQQFEQELWALLARGQHLALRFHQEDTPQLREEYENWVQDGIALIGSRNQAETKGFDLAGKSFDPRDQLQEKVIYVRDKLLPKVVAGLIPSG